MNGSRVAFMTRKVNVSGLPRPPSVCNALLMRAPFLPVLVVALLFPVSGSGEALEGQALLEAIEDSYVRVTRTEGFSPFRGVIHAVVSRSRVPVAKHRKRLVNHTGRFGNMALIRPEAHLDLLNRVEGLGGWTLPDAMDPGPGPAESAWKVEVRREGRAHAFSFTRSGASADGRYREIVEAVAGLVREHTGDMPFRNVFHDLDDRGYVDIDSRPPARILIDGRPTGHRTPLYTYELASGTHTVRLIASREGLDRTYEFKVEPGKTTVLHLDLH